MLARPADMGIAPRDRTAIRRHQRDPLVANTDLQCRKAWRPATNPRSLRGMKPTNDNSGTLAADAETRLRLRGWLTAILVSIGFFLALAVLQSLASYDELQQRGSARSFISVFGGALGYYPPWMIFSVVLFAIATRMRLRLTRIRWASVLFIACTLFFFLPYMIYEIGLDLIHRGKSLAGIADAMRGWSSFGYFVDFLLFCGCFLSIVGLALIRGQWQRERENQRLEAQMLGLTLELERQRLAAIQAQLEPHFLFNALSAISALVRTDDKRSALAAITRLSELLRYTMTASRRDWVELGDELDFVRDYLQLQSLRHGDRLQFEIEADERDWQGISCPPLLLQPLVENSLRHGLETRTGISVVRLRLARSGNGVSIRIDNPLPEAARANPGLGLGLANTRERLRVRYKDAARLVTRENAGRFEVELFLPDVETE
jgi:two-component system, LytTR family, sensor histidine kinase AlgZ